jgi:hypothetical protein
MIVFDGFNVNHIGSSAQIVVQPDCARMFACAADTEIFS